MKRGGHKKVRPSRLWHRWLGFILLLPLLFMSVTGWLLNHADHLGLEDSPARSRWVLDHYGMHLKGEPKSYPVGDSVLSAWDGQLFLNGTALEAQGQPVGAVRLTNGIAVAMTGAIRLLAADGSLIETLEESSLPPGAILRVGRDPEARLLVETGPSEVWRFNEGFLTFEKVTEAAGAWSEAVPTPAALREAMQASYGGDGLPWSRVLLDLHSGRFFGAAGRWLLDGFVVLVLLLSGTGLVVGLRALSGNGQRHGSS